jgi:hypothetical protein
MRSFVSSFAASAAFAIAILTSLGVPAQPAAEQPVICAALSVGEPAKLIEVCTALIDNPATPDGDRLDATITRAAALHNSGQTGKALAEIDSVVAKDPNRARAFRAPRRDPAPERQDRGCVRGAQSGHQARAR